MVGLTAYTIVLSAGFVLAGVLSLIIARSSHPRVPNRYSKREAERLERWRVVDQMLDQWRASHARKPFDGPVE